MMNENKYLLGKFVEQYADATTKTITFVVTEDCNLRCKYCYMTGKNTKNKMTFEIAKETINYIFNHEEEFPESRCIFEFIGGEPLLEIDLIDKISDYIKYQLYTRNHKWFGNYRFNIATNGLLYSSDKVQKYIAKNKGCLNIGISVDGSKLKHDMQRVDKDGNGSFDRIVGSIPLWLEQMPGASTKATFSSDDLPLLKESIIGLWDLGIKNVLANVVFENVWKDGDDIILEEQLKALSDYIIENDKYKDCICTFFDEYIGSPQSEENLKSNWCGTGRMLAIDYKGDFYPCIRFMSYSLNNKKEISIGSLKKGFDKNMVRRLSVANTISQSTEECLSCDVAKGCAWCQGNNYDEADSDTIYKRSINICKLHKARVRANDYYWTKLQREKGIAAPELNPKRKYNMIFILDNDSTNFCNYTTGNYSFHERMSEEVFRKGTSYCEKNFYNAIFLHSKDSIRLRDWNGVGSLRSITNIVDSTYEGIIANSLVTFNNTKMALEYSVDKDHRESQRGCFLRVERGELKDLSNAVGRLMQGFNRINLVLGDVLEYTELDIKLYEKQIELISKTLIESYKQGRHVQFNKITDKVFLNKHDDCTVGRFTFTLAPNGKLYNCPGDYYTRSEDYIGTLDDEIVIKNAYLFEREKSPICSSCDAYHCQRCTYTNKLATMEVNIPSELQCVISHIEREISRRFLEGLKDADLSSGIKSIQISKLDYRDPYEIVNK